MDHVTICSFPKITVALHQVQLFIHAASEDVTRMPRTDCSETITLALTIMPKQQQYQHSAYAFIVIQRPAH